MEEVSMQSGSLPEKDIEDFVNTVVLPGDVLLRLDPLEDLERKIVLGPGLRRDAGKILAMKTGVLRKKEPKVFFVDNHQKRYVPVRGEDVVGVVTKKGGEDASVDIGSSEPAFLSLLAFEGATKRNKPLIKVGDVVYAKILVACRDMGPEIVCVNSYGKSVGLGIVDDGGFLFSVSLEYVRKLLSPKCSILKRLGEKICFEAAIGLNGRVWVKASDLSKTLLVTQVLTILEHATETEVQKACEGIFDSVSLF